MARTLNKLSDLRETKYGQPPPRHGLNLLWWFAHYCVQIDSNRRMTSKCNPKNGAFGFHRFYNSDNLLPKIHLPYYEVGNLNNAGSLPDYVTLNYTGRSDSSNKDRIIVSFNSNWNRFEDVYVTQHSDQTHFDQNRTYRISSDLLKNIQDLSLEDFLRGRTNRSEHISINIPQSVQTNNCQSISNEPIQDNRGVRREEFPRIPRSQQLSISRPQSVQHSKTNTCESWMCCCTLIGCGLLMLLMAGVGLYFWLK